MPSHSRVATLTASALVATVLLTAGCAVESPPPRRVYVPAPVAYGPPPPADVVSVYIDPPLAQPAPVAIGWAPPPMLVEVPPPRPFDEAEWIGGYWAWQGSWVWAAGRWAPPPQPGFVWVQPYYEHRDVAVLYIGGHWCAPGVVFVPPPPQFRYTLAVALPGALAGPPPMGPPGIFVPAPPGSRPGLIVPAPLGTPPAVVMSAPPVTNVGMRVQIDQSRTTNVTNVTNITNVTNVTVIAPAAAMTSGRAYQASIPAQAHLAAALPPVVRAMAPTPQSARPMQAYRAGEPPAQLPPPQPVRATAPPPRPVAAVVAPPPAARAAGMAERPSLAGEAAPRSMPPTNTAPPPAPPPPRPAAMAPILEPRPAERMPVPEASRPEPDERPMHAPAAGAAARPAPRPAKPGEAPPAPHGTAKARREPPKDTPRDKVEAEKAQEHRNEPER